MTYSILLLFLFILYSIVSYSIVFQSIVFYLILLDSIPFHYILYYIIFHSTVFYSIVFNPNHASEITSCELEIVCIICLLELLCLHWLVVGVIIMNSSYRTNQLSTSYSECQTHPNLVVILLPEGNQELVVKGF